MWDRDRNQSMSGRKGHVEATAGHCWLKLEGRLRFLWPREISVIDDLLAAFLLATLGTRVFVSRTCNVFPNASRFPEYLDPP